MVIGDGRSRPYMVPMFDEFKMIQQILVEPSTGPNLERRIRGALANRHEIELVIIFGVVDDMYQRCPEVGMFLNSDITAEVIHARYKDVVNTVKRVLKDVKIILTVPDVVELKWFNTTLHVRGTAANDLAWRWNRQMIDAMRIIRRVGDEFVAKETDSDGRSAGNRTIRARSTCLCARFRSPITAAERARSRVRCSISTLCCAALFTATKRIDGRVTASQAAAAISRAR